MCIRDSGKAIAERAKSAGVEKVAFDRSGFSYHGRVKAVSYTHLDVYKRQVAIPRIRDFRGVSPKAFDGRGNYSLGVKEQIIFPEIDYDKIDTLRGLDITITTSARTNEEGRALLEAFKFPFRT